MRTIKQFSDKSTLEYDKGSFDSWCVYLRKPGGVRDARRDKDYFQELLDLGKKYGNLRVYSDFVEIYDRTNKEIEGKAATKIAELVNSYPQEDRLKVDVTLWTLYATMIAEENKGQPLGKRIKRLGVHMLLVDNRSVGESANFAKGKHVPELDALCRKHGF